MTVTETSTATVPPQQPPPKGKIVIPADLKVGDRDRAILELGDEAFTPFTWADLVDIISEYTNSNESL